MPSHSSPSKTTVSEYLPRGGVETPQWKRDVDRRADCRAIVSQLIARAIAAGTHTARPLQLCYDCRRWVAEIWYVDRHKSLCPLCATRAGLGVAGITIEELQKKAADGEGSSPRAVGTDAPQDAAGVRDSTPSYKDKPPSRVPRVTAMQAIEL